MVFITGDTHIPIDLRKLKTANFPLQKELTKDDFVIICGDFGGVWNNGSEEKYWVKWLENKNFTTLFIDGNHENFDLLESYPVINWNGGKVHFISDSVIHLMRGQVFSIAGHKFFTFGGGFSIDKQFRTSGKSWWKQEAPSYDEFIEGLDNLNKCNWEVDYIITHTIGLEIMKKMCYLKENEMLNEYFDRIDDFLAFKHWYFGHFHEDYRIDEKHTIVYQMVLRVV